MSGLKKLKFILVNQRYECIAFFLLWIIAGTGFSQPYISSDTPPSCYEIEARVRNGYTGYEGAIFTPSTPSPGQPGGSRYQMDPSGMPVWKSNGNNYGDIHTFLFTYEWATGTSVWKVDYNRDGDFLDAKESVKSVTAKFAHRGFHYLNVMGQGYDFGKTAKLDHFTINGVDFGSFISSSNTPFNILFEDVSGLFTDVTISGSFSFSGHGTPERPRIWVRMGDVNVAPTCELTRPTEGAVYNPGNKVLLAAKAIDLVGSVVLVEFYDGDTKIGEDLTYPYSYEWLHPLAGNRTLRAKAIDSDQAYTWSAPVHILVNAPPSAIIIKPANGQQFEDPDTIWMEAVSFDPDTASSMEFFFDNVSIGVDSVAPFIMPLINVQVGNHYIRVKSTDLYSAFTYSLTVNFSVRCIREDLNIDSVVSTPDFLQMLIAFGSVCGTCPPDFNDDGTVNTFDLLRLLSKLGYMCQ